MSTQIDADLSESENDLEKIRGFPNFDVADYLDSPDLLAAYLSEAFFKADSPLIAESLRTASRAKGMAEVANKAGLARESLYKALRPGSQPRLETILAVLKALGMQLVVQPIPVQSEVPDIDNGDDLEDSKDSDYP
jgi:probable addiction module antidote protein